MNAGHPFNKTSIEDYFKASTELNCVELSNLFGCAIPHGDNVTHFQQVGNDAATHEPQTQEAYPAGQEYKQRKGVKNQTKPMVPQPVEKKHSHIIAHINCDNRFFSPVAEWCGGDVTTFCLWV